jgi:glycosyltransferase involved in cell wall biosynthesis
VVSSIAKNEVLLEPVPNPAGAPLGSALRSRVVVFSELYWPEDTSTGFFLTGVAEGLARDRDVLVLCAQPTYRMRGRAAPWCETRNGVSIVRVPSTTFPRGNPLGRVANALTMAASFFAQAVLRLRATDRVLVVTNPPLLPYLVALAARLRRARTTLLVHDVYPEVMEVTGMVAPGGVASRTVRRLARWLYRSVDHVVVLGRDMASLVSRSVESPSRVTVIPNWGDVDEIRPAPREENPLLGRLGLGGAFVVQWLGNMGRTHALEDVLQSAVTLRERRDIHFLLIGDGAKRAWLEREVSSLGLGNVTVLPPCERAELAMHLGACDLSLIAFLPGMAGVSVPSRLYNVLASGRPVLAAAEADSDLCRVVDEERVGWTVPAGDAAAMAAAIVDAASTDPRTRTEMRERARHAAEARYSREAVLRRWRALFDGDGPR